MKKLFLGKKPLERKYLPKIEEHLFLFFSAIIFSFVLIGQLLVFFTLEKQDFFELINNYFFKFLLAIDLGLLVLNIFLSIRIIAIMPKTETGKLLAIMEIIFSTILPLSVFNLVISLTTLKFNEIVYE